MRPTLFAALLALLLPASLQAQNLPLITNDVTKADGDGLILATCRTGEGCHCYLSNHSLSSMQVLVPITPPQGVANPVLVRIDDTLHWSSDSSHAIDLVYGGDGLCDPQIFDAAATGLPRNGPWQMTITGHNLSGCPKEVATAITGEVFIGQSERRVIDWPRPFNMSPLTADNPAAGPWVNRGGGLWFTELMNASGTAGGNARVTMTARIITPTEISILSEFSTDVLVAITGKTCRSTTQATMRFGG